MEHHITTLTEAHTTLVANMASFAQNVNLHTTSTNERVVDLVQQQRLLTQQFEQFFIANNGPAK